MTPGRLQPCPVPGNVEQGSPEGVYGVPWGEESLWGSPGGEGGSAPLYLDDAANVDRAKPSKGRKAVSALVRGERLSCEPKWAVYRCACKARPVPEGACMNADCDTCAEYTGARRARNAWEKFDHGRAGRPVCYTVLTVPPWLREEAARLSTWKLWRKKLVAYLKKRWGLDYGVEWSQPTGDNKDFFHPHINLLWVVKNGFRTFIDVGELRAAWGKIIGSKAKVVIHHQYVPGRQLQKILHRFRYVFRAFTGWAFWMGNVKWYGNWPKPKKEDKRDRSCGRCGLVPERAGWISEELRQEWDERGRPHFWLLTVLGRGPPED